MMDYKEWISALEGHFYGENLKRVANAIQRLVDGALDELFLSMPPRVGRTEVMNAVNEMKVLLAQRNEDKED